MYQTYKQWLCENYLHVNNETETLIIASETQITCIIVWVYWPLLTPSCHFSAILMN